MSIFPNTTLFHIYRYVKNGLMWFRGGKLHISLFSKFVAKTGNLSFSSAKMDFEELKPPQTGQKAGYCAHITYLVPINVKCAFGEN